MANLFYLAHLVRGSMLGYSNNGKHSLFSGGDLRVDFDSSGNIGSSGYGKFAAGS